MTVERPDSDVALREDLRAYARQVSRETASDPSDTVDAHLRSRPAQRNLVALIAIGVVAGVVAFAAGIMGHTPTSLR
ncbi:MAG: hypothetical protein AAFR04_16245 [Pseudomonadota bacterium]